VKSHNFAKWLHRKHGTLVIWRHRKDGVMGNALPCVICRKAMEKYNIQWIAGIGGDDKWVNSKNPENLPSSMPTNKQRRYIFKKEKNT
jgi:hypothetical protein